MVSRFLGRKCRLYGPEMIMEALEERIVLDASVSPVPNDNANSGTTTDPQAQTSDQSGQTSDAGNAAAPGAAPAAAPDPAQEVFSQNLHVVLVSNALDRVEAVSTAAAEDAHVVVFDAQKDNLSTISAMLDNLSHSTGQKIGVLAIVGHGDGGLVQIGADQISSSNLFKFIPTLEALANDLSEDAQIQFYGCSVAESEEGRGLIDQIAFYTHADVFASSNDTGGNLNDWTLEYVSDAGTPLVQLFDFENLPTDGSSLLYPGRPPLDSLTTYYPYQYYSALDSLDLTSVNFGHTSYSETWIFTLTETTSISIGMQTLHPEWSHNRIGDGFIDCWLDVFPYEGTEPVASSRITYNDDWGTPGDTSHAPVYSGNDALIYNYSLAAGTYCIQATHWSDPAQPQYNYQTGGYYILSSVELAYWIHNNANAPTSLGIPNPPTQPEDFTPAYTYDVGQFFTDQQGDTLTYEFGAVTYNAGLTLDGLTLDTSTGVITFTSDANSSGSVDIQVRACDPNDYDGGLYSQYYTFTFTVTPQKEWYTDSARVSVQINGSTTDVVLTGHDTSHPDLSAVKFDIDPQYYVKHGTLTAVGGVYHDPSDSDPDSTYHQRYTYTPTAGYYGEDAFQFTFQVQKGAWNQYSGTGTAVGTADNTYSVQFGDLNNDGFTDYVEGNYGEYNRYYLNDGLGNFTATDLGTDTLNTTCIQLGDVNGDGWLDIVAGNTGNGTYDQVYINQGCVATFFDSRAWQGFEAGYNVTGSNAGTRYSIALGDMDGDGDLDLVSVRYDNNPDRIYFNDGMGHFSTLTDLPATYQRYSRSVALGDMDGDGDLDVVVGKYRTSGRDIIYFNDGTGHSFTVTQFGLDNSTYRDQTYAIKVGDLDNDGDLDIVTGNYINSTALSGRTKVYINAGNGTFSSNYFGSTNYDTRSIDLGDLDRDGYLDLIIGNNGAANRYYLNPGTGLFSGGGTAFSGSNATYSVKLGDVNGDGDLDMLAGNYNQQDLLWTNLGFGTGTTWRMTEPGDVRINVSLMQNPSFEQDYSLEHPGGYSGWTIDSDTYSTFAVVKNKYTINDLAPLFDHETESDILQVSFGLPYTVKDKTADATEDVAALLAYGPNAVTMYQDVVIPANASLTAMDLHWRMAYQNDYVAVDSNAPFSATQYVAVYVYDPSGARPAPLWITQDYLNPSLMAAMRDFSVRLPDSLVPNDGSAVTVRVELEVMAQDFFFDVLADDFRFVPYPPGSVSPGPLSTEGTADMGIAAVMAVVPNSSLTMAATSMMAYADYGQESAVTGSSAESELDLTLMKVLESASQSPPLSLSTMASETEASGVTEASSGTPAPQPVETAAASGQTAGTAQTITTQAPQVQTAESSTPSVDSSYQSNPAPASTQDGTAPAPETGLSPDLSTAIGPVSTVTGDANLLLSTEFSLEPAMAVVFNLEQMSAWDVVNSQTAALAGSRDVGLAQELAAKLSLGNSFVADLDSLRLTEILA